MSRYAFAADKLHPNSVGAEAMAHHWFATLLKHDGLDVPASSRQEMDAAIRKGPDPFEQKPRSPRRPGGRDRRKPR